MGEWNPTAVVAIITALAAAGVSIYVAFRKQTTEDNKSEAELKSTDNNNVIGEWRDYARQLTKANSEAIKGLEQRHNVAINALQEQNNKQEVEIGKLQEQERKCQVDYASAMSDIRHLQREVERLTRLIGSE